MNVSAIIRHIQKTDFLNKESAISSVFEKLQEMYTSPETTKVLHALEKSVCDNIYSPANFVPIDISCNSNTKKFLADLGLNIMQEISGVFYISWNKKTSEEDGLQVILNDLHVEGKRGYIYEAFSIFKKCYPENEFELFLGNWVNAKKISTKLNKKSYEVFKGLVYLFEKI